MIPLYVLSVLHTPGPWGGLLQFGFKGCWGPGVVHRGGAFADSILGWLNSLSDGKGRTGSKG